MDIDKRLDSWKEIAEYVNREIRTCQRWEKKLGLPVYRINNKSTHSKVFAFKSEIDQWFKERKKMHEINNFILNLKIIKFKNQLTILFGFDNRV